VTTVTFDTLKFVEKLKAAGIPEVQAKAMSEAFQEAQGELDVVTKRDLKELELKIEARFEGVRGELTLIKWMLGLLLGGVLALILKAFFPGQFRYRLTPPISGSKIATTSQWIRPRASCAWIWLPDFRQLASRTNCPSGRVVTIA
jgi:hypothetical protein